jgi:hypothetical protein
VLGVPWFSGRDLRRSMKLERVAGTGKRGMDYSYK